jgi:membrane protein implicated in regulation of membrane protease activity
MPPTDGRGRPSALLWLASVVSLLLPVVGLAAIFFGGFRSARGDASGWYFVGAGAALILADIVIDWLWAHPAVSKSDEPGLNRRGAELVGQVVTVIEAIEVGGRGKVRAADTVWPAEGVKAAAGTRVKVAGVKGTVLIVEPT